jgi:hypothetical protein
MADDTIDVTGQVGGPSPEEQARVDAEQAELVSTIRAKHAEEERERRKVLDERIQRAMEAAAERSSLLERMKLLEARVTMLESR